MGGCTNCGQKGGCDTRKSGMFAAINEALGRLYPTRRWGERDEAMALDAGISREEGEALAAAIGERMGTLTLFRPGDPEEWCDYIYVLCLGRTPAIVQIREDHQAGARLDAGAAAGDSGEVGMGLDERYLRVVLSGVTRFAGVQEVAMTLRAADGDADGELRARVGGADGGGGEVVITESARSGVFDPILLPRMQALVAILAEWHIRHIDFGEIVEAPEGFDAASYPEHFGGVPVIANYLFYPQPPTTVSTVVLGGAHVAPSIAPSSATSSP